MRETLCDVCYDENERGRLGGFGPLVWVRDFRRGRNEGVGYVTTEIRV